MSFFCLIWANMLQGQRSLKESQGALLGKVEELSELLKQEKQRVLTLEGQLNAATLSLQALGEVLFKLHFCSFVLSFRVCSFY